MTPQESFTLDEGIDAYGTRTQVKFYSDQVQKIQTFDGTDLAEECKRIKRETEGEKWGEMRKVASIPMAVYGKAMLIRDNKERMTYIKTWLSQNTDFITFNRYMK